nr:Pycsar system effector family protein [Prauserella shujinwangii]
MTDHDPVETAWRVHAAIVEWTGKVDAKASFAATIESVILGGVITLSDSRRLLADLNSFPAILRDVGLAILAFAVLCAISVVTPRLRSSKMKNEASDNFIYFGHLRHWTPFELAEVLAYRDTLPVLSRQLVVMSKVAWQKHRRVQVSLLASVVAVALISLASWLA